MPRGFGLTSDLGTRVLEDHTLWNPTAGRLVRLSVAGRTALAGIRERGVRSVAEGALARRLTDTGICHPCPPAAISRADVVVVIPARDRVALLTRCLSSLDADVQVVVVDDNSSRRHEIAQLAKQHAAVLLRRDSTGGPGAARETGIAATSSELVAFLDSDCIAPPGWLESLTQHFEDPCVGGVAPRIVPLETACSATRYAAARGNLDLGPHPALVAPGARVAYVPTAALIVRRSALEEVSRAGTVFDPSLRYGEDVDLIWRLSAAGWRVRYEPSVEVAHAEPTTWPSLLARRFHYGTSAGALSRRHPSAISPLVLHPWPTLTVAALLARRPGWALITGAATFATHRRSLIDARLAPGDAPALTVQSVSQTFLGAGRYLTQFGAPLLAAAMGSRKHRLAAASLLLGRPIATWLSKRPEGHPVGFILGHVADDVAYGAGVYAGAFRARTAAPLIPRVLWRKSSPRKGTDG